MLPGWWTCWEPMSPSRWRPPQRGVPWTLLTSWMPAQQQRSHRELLLADMSLAQPCIR